MNFIQTNKPAILDKVMQDKYNQLKQIVSKAKEAAIGFSGGIDSTFLLKVCADMLGEKAIAITVKSEVIPAHELEDANSIADRIGVKHIILKENVLAIPGFAQNNPDRCYICKKKIFLQIKKAAQLHGIRRCFDGSNLDDDSDFRPGHAALKELGIRSPLIEAGFKKTDIRTVSAALDLPTWNKPAQACLASRFPYYSKITINALKQVEKAEIFLKELGMNIFRVRHHDLLARIELGEKEKKLLLKLNLGVKIVKHFKKLGYKYIALDLEGYRTGSINEML